jgi:thymidine kinase
MAKLYFRYSAMNSGKTTALIQAAHNYEERGMRVLVIKPAIDSKGEHSVISRLGIKRHVDIMLASTDSIPLRLKQAGPADCILVDEAQFLTPVQVSDLFWYANDQDVPVLAYGLRTDFKTEGFPGAARLLQLAHEIAALKTICRCGKKALLNARKINGTFVLEGSQVEIDDKSHVEYEALCAEDYKQLVLLARYA